MVRAFLACLAFALPARAALVVVVNGTEREQSFAVRHAPGGKAPPVELVPGECRGVPVGKASVLVATLNGREATFTLDPYSAYAFVTDRAGNQSFQGIQLAAPLPKADDVPDEPAAAKPLVVPVRLYADDAEKRARPVWEKALRTRFEVAAAVVTAQCGVRFELAGVGEWKSTPAAKDFGELLAEFETAAPAAANELHLGFTGRELKKETDLALTKAPFATHILLREGEPRTEAERVDVLAHHLGQYLGAVRSADQASVMRANLRDGRATNVRHVTRFDPLNVLAVGIWAEEASAGRGRTFDGLRPPARERLAAIYKTQAAIHEVAKSDDTEAKEYAALLEPPPAVAVEPKPAAPEKVEPKPEPPSKYTKLQQAIRTVVKAVVVRADDNFRLPAGHPKKLSHDALTCEYFRIAAEVAQGMDDEHKGAGYLIGLGIALDDSPLLRTNLLTRGVCAGVESDEEIKERLAVLGAPTIRNRRDLCQHYVVSMALVALRGPEAAELAGLAKEVLDMKGTSGFSFIDLAVDYAGVEMGRWVMKQPRRVEFYAKGFQLDQHVPDLKGLREGFNEKQFADEFRSTDDAKFKAVTADIRTRVAALMGYREWK